LPFPFAASSSLISLAVLTTSLPQPTLRPRSLLRLLPASGRQPGARSSRRLERTFVDVDSGRLWRHVGPPTVTAVSRRWADSRRRDGHHHRDGFVAGATVAFVVTAAGQRHHASEAGLWPGGGCTWPSEFAGVAGASVVPASESEWTSPLVWLPHSRPCRAQDRR